ncbi:stage 0 sporulation protein [Clostridia bacterium]|nr:stage 0 sporulation protein [Clostridia bacterium]
MAFVVGVRFKKLSKIYHLDPNNLIMQPGTHVIAQTLRGVEFGTVELGNRELPDFPNVTMKKVLRIATSKDIAQEQSNKRKEQEAVEIFYAKIREHRLDMKLVEVDLAFDLSKIIFYFTADGRVDFRELVKTLAVIFRMRIELRQIGVRDEAKIIDSVGICGCNLCCARFLTDFAPVSIKMAKDQGIALNPAKISGACGRLMCCLKYEQDMYEELAAGMPSVGDVIKTADGIGVVVSVTTLKRTLRASIKKDNETVFNHYSADEIKILEHRQDDEISEKFGKVYD